MRKRAFRYGSMIVAATLALGVGSQADARRSVADKPEFLLVNAFDPGCVIGDPTCTAFTLPFSVTFGGSSTNQVFVYQNGFISFGSPVGGGLLASATFDQYGVPVIAPLAFTDAGLGANLPFAVGFGTASSVTYDTPLNAGSGDFGIFAFDDDDGNSLDTVYLLLRKAATGDDLLFEFVHGSCFCLMGSPPEGPELTGAAYGYKLGGQSLFKDNLTEADVDATLAFRYSPGGASGAVPEPATWAMMLVGFGLIGATVRLKNRAQTALQPA